MFITKNINEVTIDEIVDILVKKGLVILPTETLYAAIVDATNSAAIEKLIRYKNRPLGKPFSIAVIDRKMAEEYVNLNSNAKSLYKKYLPGPLTIVSKGKHKVAPGVESEHGTLGIRVPKYDLVLKVVEKLSRPVTATSANASYKKRPYNISDILDNLSAKIFLLAGSAINLNVIVSSLSISLIQFIPLAFCFARNIEAPPAKISM